MTLTGFIGRVALGLVIALVGSSVTGLIANGPGNQHWTFWPVFIIWAVVVTIVMVVYHFRAKLGAFFEELGSDIGDGFDDASDSDSTSD